MVKFKGRSSMKKYLKSKPIKWNFNFRYCCTSETVYLCQSNLKLCKRESAEEKLGPVVVLEKLNSFKIVTV